MLAHTIKTAEGVSMPRIIYGTAWKADRTQALVEQAVRCGFRGIDTACQPKHYHEPGVGAALAALQASGIPRESLFVQTKYTSLGGQDPKRIPYDARASLPDQVAQSVEASLRNLQTSYVDSLVLHSPMSSIRDTVQVWHAMEEAYRAGKVKQLGISNCYELETLQAVYEAASVKPAVIQNRFYADSHYDRALREWCSKQGIVYQSFWTLTANPHVLKNSVVQQLAGQKGKTPAQIFFRALMQMGIVPLTGTTNEQHMREDLAVLDFSLTDDEVHRIDALLR